MSTTQQNLDYAIIPLDSVEVSSNVDGHEAVKLFDGNLQTFWTPSLQQTSFAQVNFLKVHLVKGVDIAFNKGNARRHTFEIQILSPTNNRWVSVSVYETKGSTNEPIRINIPDVITKSVRLNFLSHVENGHMGVIPEVSELRVYGEITADEAPDAAKIPDLQCPQGYEKDPVTNRCVKNVQYEFLNPSSVTGKSTDPVSDIPNNDPQNVINDDTNNSYVMKGANSKITQTFDKEYEVTAINLDINNSQKAEYHFTVNLSPSKQIPVLLQQDLASTNIVLDDPVRTKTVELIFTSTTAPDQKLEVVKMNVLGNVNTTDAPPVSQEPADKGVARTGFDSDMSKWTAVNMRDDPAKGKITDKNKDNVRVDFASKANAQTWLDWKKGQTTTTPPTEPPVDPPTEPPTEPPVVTPGEGGVDMFGTKTIYPTTGRMFKDYTLNPNQGLRHDFKGRPSDMTNIEVTGYFSLANPPDDEVSGKFSVVNHSNDGDPVQCLDCGVDNNTGACRYRYENPHPTYTGNLGKEIRKGVPLQAKFVGYKFIRINKGADVVLEIWQDAGNNEGSTPSNQWVQLANWTVKPEHRVTEYPNGVITTLRLDGDGVEDNLKQKWISMVEVKPT